MYGNTDITGFESAVLRRSSSVQQGTSISNQGRTVDSVIKQYSLNIVKEYVLEGVTGSIPGNRSDIDDVIELKQNLGLKRLLLIVPDHTRFTRAGAGHGASLLYQLRAKSILVYFVAEDLLVENDLTLQLALMLLSAAHQTAKSIARGSTIGTDARFEAGKTPHTRVAPFGLDRLYRVDGKAVHIIRNLPDGTQEMLDPNTREVIRRFGQNPKTGIPAHYIKQKNETVELCHGAPDALARLFMLFKMRYLQRMKYRRIALELNEANIRSPLNKEWSAASVQTIILNPIYIGLQVRYRTTRGIYVQGGSPNGEPEPSEVTPEELDQNESIKVRHRKREKWKEKLAKAFESFLPEEIRDAARAATNAHLDATANGPMKHYNRDPHFNSLYILKYILHCKKTGIPMTGRASFKGGKRTRKYGLSKGSQIPRRNKCDKRVLAEPIEQSIMEMVREVVLNRPRMIEAMQAVVKRAARQTNDEPDQVEQMQKKIKKLRKQIALLSEDVGDDEDELDPNDPVVQKVTVARREIDRLNIEVRKASVGQPMKPSDVNEAIERLAEALEGFGRKINPSETPLIVAVLQLLISRIDVDRDTKEFEVQLAVPSWLPELLSSPVAGSLESLIASSQRIEAHPENREILAIFQCDKSGRPLCYSCRRLKAAA